MRSVSHDNCVSSRDRFSKYHLLHAQGCNQCGANEANLHLHLKATCSNHINTRSFEERVRRKLNCSQKCPATPVKSVDTHKNQLRLGCADTQVRKPTTLPSRSLPTAFVCNTSMLLATCGKCFRLRDLACHAFISLCCHVSLFFPKLISFLV